MNSDFLEYKQKVWQFLESIKPGKMYTVAKLAKQKNREVFIAAIKEYMEALPWQGYITFNHNYTKFYRVHPPPQGGN